MSSAARTGPDDAGQALVEFSLVLPIVLLLLLGILQAGLVLNARQTVENAARIAADTYARTLSTSEADTEGTRAAEQLSPRLAPPAASTAYTVIGQKRQQRTVVQQIPRQVCQTITGFRTPQQTCRTVFDVTASTQTTTVRTDHPATAADPGKAGELIRATIRYDYPIPVGGLARFGFPTHVALTGEAVSLIEARAPATASTACYELVRSFETFGNPVDLSATVNGSPAARIRVRPGADQLVEIVASPGQVLRQYAPRPGDQTVKREIVRLDGSARTVSSDSSVTWSFFGGSSTASYHYRAAVTLRPATDASCGVSGQR